MELLLHRNSYKVADSVQNFMNFYYSSSMKHLASDLLDEGLLPGQISEAISAAITAAKASNIEICKHFMLVYSGIDRTIIRDCKLSDLVYGLVIINADSSLCSISKFQVEVLNTYFEKYL
jgi:hypothetical protein